MYNVLLGTPVESVERTLLRVGLSAQEHVECPQLPSLFSLTNVANRTANTGYVCVKVSVARPTNEKPFRLNVLQAIAHG